MNKKTKTIRNLVILILIAAAAFILLLFMRGKGLRGQIIALYKTITVDRNIDLDKYDNFRSDSTAWYENYKVIAHGLGEIDGFHTTNSKEAFEHSYQKGIRIFEADISKTADGKFVLSHDFEGLPEIPTYDQYMTSKIAGNFTPLSLEWMIQTLETYPDIYIMTDIKSDEFAEILTYLVNQAGENEEILERFIIQVYSKENLEHTREVYPFSNILFSAYKSGYTTQKEIAELCLKNNIPVVTQGAMKNIQKDIKYFKQKNIKVYAFTINETSYAKELIKLGYDGIYSDVLAQEEIFDE